MSEATTAAKEYPKPSGYMDGGAVWINRHGTRYKCKSCGKNGHGVGSGERAHRSYCPVTAPLREHFAGVAKGRADKANAARVLLAGIDWATVTDDLVLRLAAEVGKRSTWTRFEPTQ